MWYRKGNNQWAWTCVSKNFTNQKAKWNNGEKEKEQNIWEVWDDFKRLSIHRIEILERERERGKEKDIEDAFELLMTKFFFPKLMTPKLKTPNLRVMSFREHLVR